VSRKRQQPRRYPRTARANEVVLEVLGDELERLSDPRLGFVTLTGVEMNADLRVADVYYTVLGTEEEQAATAVGLRSATSHLRSVLGREVSLKFVPELRFHADRAVEQGARIEAIIRDLHERDPGSAG
jgi:ribosome-binding factor A